MSKLNVNVGVLALQGAFQEHIEILNKLKLLNTNSEAVHVHAYAVRLPDQLVGADALVLPGGESTTIGKVAARWGLVRAILFLLQCTYQELY